MSATTRTRVVPRWLPPTALTVSAIGLLISIYMTYEHFTANTTLACVESSTINCAKVTESQWSMLLGIPVALLGVVFFVAMLVLCQPRLFRADTRIWDVARIGGCVVGLGFALYLVWAELFHIGAICLWCTAAHVLTLGLLVVLIFGTVLIEPASVRRRDDSA